MKCKCGSMRSMWSILHRSSPTERNGSRPMTETIQFLIKHGLPLIFGAVFLEQMGLPLPASPWLLAAGSLSAIGKFSLLSGIGISVIACLLADTIWFYLGRYRGNQ